MQRRTKDSVMLFRFLTLVHVCAAFPLKCPEPAQWSTRARSHCLDPSKYFCLKNDIIKGYSENCTVFDFLQPGRKHVLRGGLDADICSSDRYQPWPILFYTNVSTNCIFSKSACNEEGQVVYDNGNRSTDIKCRCDYTRGYDFIVKPRNQCFCIPSEEDCSCYLKMCEGLRYVLSPDYGCFQSRKHISINQCKPIIDSRINRESNQSDSEDNMQTQNISTAEKYKTTVAILVTSISLAVIFLSIPLAKVFANWYKEQNNFISDLTISPIKPQEGNTISISCEVKQKNNTVTWYKDERAIIPTNRMHLNVDERKCILTITKADRGDDGVYGIDFGGVKRQQKLKVEAKYNIPIEIQKMDKTEKERYIKILETGIEKMYSIKILILGKERVGKTSLIKNLLEDMFDEKEPPTDGIDIKKCKVDIESKQWIHFNDDTADERLGRALRKPNELDNEPDSLRRSRKTDYGHLQNTQNTTHSKMTTDQDTQMEGGNEINKRNDRSSKQDSTKSHWLTGTSEETQVKNIFDDVPIEKDKENTTKGDEPERYDSHDIKKYRRQKDKESDVTDDIDTQLRKAFNAKVYDKKYADCIIMDFAGHKEYYSTHQTFLTKNAVNLIVFSLIEGDPFAETGDEEDNLGYWIDNIHCYAQRKQNEDGKNSGLKRTNIQTEDADESNIQAQIIMMCTGDDNPNDAKSVEKKKEWQEKFKKLRLINKRDPLIWGCVKYISNTNPSSSDLKELRSLIVEIAETTPNWGVDYPVRWINLERVINKERTRGNNILTFEYVKEEAMKCSVSISSEKEVILFLKFQHEIGNLIFYDETELRHCVILDPSWLIDAFKCIVFADECKNFSHQKFTFPEFRQNGRIKKEIFRKMIEVEYPKYKGHFDEVVGVMKKFDIIVENKSDSFICPSVITKGSLTFESICINENVNETLCSRSPWLCMEFDFLPPALFNHLLVFCMRDTNFEKAELYNEIGIFCLRGSNDLDKFFLCKSERTIAVQMFTRNKKIQNAQTLYKSILDKLTTITNKYGFTVYYTPKMKCGKADYSNKDKGNCLEEIMKNELGYCYHCKENHNYADFSRVWIEEEPTCAQKINNMSEYHKSVQNLTHVAVVWIRDKVKYFHHYLILDVGFYSVDIIHYTPKKHAKKAREVTRVTRQTIRFDETDSIFLDFSAGVFFITRQEYPSTSDEIEMAYLRACYRSGKAEYSLTSNNCESFVTWVLTGEAKCEQFEQSGEGKRILMGVIESGIDHRNKVIKTRQSDLQSVLQIAKKYSGSASSATGAEFLGAFVGQIVCPIPVVGGVIGGAVEGVVASLVGRATGSAASGKILDAVTD